MPDLSEPIESLKNAFCAGDAPLVARLLESHPELKARINEPVAAFDAPAITQARSQPMLDTLLQAGADINAKSRWWAGGFGLLHTADPSLAAYAIERGAVVDVHAAARLGLIETLRGLVVADPSLVHARGGDGQTPLHFAGTLEAAEYLLNQGADIDARDVDHESTPAQYMVRERQEIARLLVRRGCATDVLLAAALGDEPLVRHHLRIDPECVRMRVSSEYFPMVNHRAGGTIYQWTLGWHVSAHDVARAFGHASVVRLLLEHSPDDIRLLDACWSGDEPALQSLLASHPGLPAGLSAECRRHAALAARNNNLAAVRLMLRAGLPADAPGQHGGTPLHWAAFHGNAAMAAVILNYQPPLELKDKDFNATPLGWAIHGSENGWYRKEGSYGAVVEALLEAGATPPAAEAGSVAVREVLRRRGNIT